VFPRSVTVTTRELGADMLAAMGDRDVLLMQGHGITVHAPTVERATTLAIRFDKIAKIAWELAQSGLKAYDIPEQDQAEYRRVPGRERPRTGWAALEGVETWDWKMYTRMLSQQNNLQDLLEEAKK
jgi:ribulose-5-phosphate 4-epimerase/fuculose-1-phosphate aldolase